MKLKNYFELRLLAQIKQLLKILESLYITYMFFCAILPEPVEDIYRNLQKKSNQNKDRKKKSCFKQN
ncbi:unnamed protein product [Paramecium sonneborni]|uniref:Uncharacterized protein n=1 Tax=Paramecium sonneborni TaxID=65129 RepID=A0A8S1Q171_9CILI|nr:unnamed protein product [Paramecium sonneborni]